MLQQKNSSRTSFHRIRSGAQACKRLFYSMLLALPLLSFPIKTQALPIPNNDRSGSWMNNQEGAKKAKKKPEVPSSQPEKCRFRNGIFEYRLSDGTVKKFDDLLQDEENVKETACNDSYAFILTSTSLIMVAGKESKETGGVRMGLSFTRKDMRDLYKIGLVAWAYAQDRCYFLMRDNKIREIPVFVHGETIPVYGIPRDMRSARMIFHSNFLFIAPAEGKIVVLGVADKPGYVELDLRAVIKDAEFFYKGRKLFFGKKGTKELEIRIKGPKLTDIKLVKRK